MYEYFGVILSIVGVLLSTQRSLFYGPFIISACLLYGWVFFQARLYADSLLQVIFLLVAIYGWYAWIAQYKRQRHYPYAPSSLILRPFTWQALLIGLGLIVIGTISWGWCLQHGTNDPFPFLDAGLSSASLVGSLWTARRYRANWILWIVVDIIYCGLFINRDLYPTAGLYGGFILISFYGYRAWGKKEETETV